jgi:hypothetical protein
LDLPRAAFLILALFSPRGVVRLPLAGAALRAARFTFLRSSLSVMLEVSAMSSLCAFLKRGYRAILKSLKLGELLHQLFNAVLLKLYCNLGVIPIPFASKDGSLPVFRVPDA